MLIYRSRAQAIVYEFSKSIFDRRRKVLIPANACNIIPITYMKLDIPFEIIDISLKTLSMDLEVVKNILDERGEEIQGIHFVHGYGYESDELNKELLKIKKKYNKIIIDDKCLCKPNINETRKFADMTLFSTGYSKYADIGRGGFAYINDELVSEIGSQHVEEYIGATRCNVKSIA